MATSKRLDAEIIRDEWGWAEIAPSSQVLQTGRLDHNLVMMIAKNH